MVSPLDYIKLNTKPKPTFFASLTSVSPSFHHLPLVLYLLLILVLSGYVLSSYRKRSKDLNSQSLTFVLLGISALGFTWSYMILYFERSFIESALRANIRPTKYTTAEWLASTSLFQEAWERVCKTPLGWLWSQVLCGWTVGPFLVILERESKRGRIKRPWAYMLLGQTVAISVAQSILFSILSLSPSSTPPPRTISQPTPPEIEEGPSVLLWTTVLLSTITVGLTPSTISTPFFLPNLLLMHLLILLPLIPLPSSLSSLTTKKFSTYKQLYYSLSITLLALRVPHLIPFFPLDNPYELPKRLLALGIQSLQTLLEHPAQTSIGFDVIFTSYSYLLFEGMKLSKKKMKWGEWAKLAAVGVGMPLLGVGAVASWWEGEKEVEDVQVVEKKKKKAE